MMSARLSLAVIRKVHLARAVPIALGILLTGATTADGGLVRSAPPFERPPKGPASFFVTSRGLDGANLQGVAGADAHCQALAAEVGLGTVTWRAYLSTQSAAGRPVINARDRIGQGPWFNVKGIRIARTIGELHGDTLAQARAGNAISQAVALTERGERINGEDEPDRRHDILTGSTIDGRAYRDRYDRTCRNWTYSGADGSAQVGHSDRDSRGLSISWNSAHQSVGCSLSKLNETGGTGLFYCFATHLPRSEPTRTPPR